MQPSGPAVGQRLAGGADAAPRRSRRGSSAPRSARRRTSRRPRRPRSRGRRRRARPRPAACRPGRAHVVLRPGLEDDPACLELGRRDAGSASQRYSRTPLLRPARPAMQKPACSGPRMHERLAALADGEGRRRAHRRGDRRQDALGRAVELLADLADALDGHERHGRVALRVAELLGERPPRRGGRVLGEAERVLAGMAERGGVELAVSRARTFDRRSRSARPIVAFARLPGPRQL